MVDNQLENLKQSFSSRLQSQGMSLEMLGMTDETFATTYRPMAVQQVQGELILESIAQQEEMVTQPEDVENKIKEIAEESNAPLDKVQEYFSKQEMRQGLEHQVQHDKVIAFLIEKAKVTEVEPKKEETEQKES